MIKKILHLSIFAVLLLNPNYGKAQCVPAGTQEFTGQMSQGNTYKISNNKYARRIPLRIPRGVTLYITGKARLDNAIDISKAKEVHVCEGGGLSVEYEGTNANLIVGPYGAVKVRNPLKDGYYNPPQLKENAVVALCGFPENVSRNKQLTKYIGKNRGTSYFIVGKVYAYNTSKSEASDAPNVTLIDYGIYYDPQRAAPIAYRGGKKFQCFPKPIVTLASAPDRCDKSFKDKDNPFYDSSANYQTNIDNVCDLTYLINHIPGYDPKTVTPIQQPGSIQVSVSEDTNGDTQGDIRLRKVNVDLYKSRKFITNKATDAKGMITFNNITQGTYTLVETDPRGYSSIWDTYYNGSSWQSDGNPKDNTVQVTVSAGQRAAVEFVDRSNKLVCNPAGAKGQGEFLSSVVGISTLDRGNDTSWLNSVKNGQLVLDSKEKGLVIPRIANPSSINNASEGMIIYDTTDNCIKLYQNNKWDCLTKKNCIKLP